MNASPVVAAQADLHSQFAATRDFAQDCDAADILAPYRRQFELPINASGQPAIYLCGHSLGLAPRAALDYVSEELAEWAASIDIPTPGELDGSEPIDDPPAGFTTWDEWRAHRWPPSVF